MTKRYLTLALHTLTFLAVAVAPAAAQNDELPNLEPNNEKYWEDFQSNWTFPAPMPLDFLKKYNNGRVGYNASSSANVTGKPHGTTDIIVEALKNISIPTDRGNNLGFNAPQVGDVIETEFVSYKIGSGKRSRLARRRMDMNCILCTRGVETTASILSACKNYTDTESGDVHSSSISFDLQTRLTSTHIPDLNPVLDLPDETVGVCYFIISPDEESYPSQDLTLPFPVRQKPRQGDRYRFTREKPDGFPNGPAQAPKPGGSSSGSRLENEKKEMGGSRIGLIVGSVVGGMVILFSIAMITFFRARKRQQRGHVVVKRIEQSASETETEIPPSYQEALADKRNETQSSRQGGAER